MKLRHPTKVRHTVTYWSVTPPAARILHAAVTAAETLAVAATATAGLVIAAGAWRLAGVLPAPLLAVAASGAAGALARLAFETTRAWKALRRWHTWPHRQINDRTQPAPTHRNPPHSSDRRSTP